MKKEREALESRVAAMLADVQADPDRITGYMAPLPTGAAEKAASAARRAFSFFFRYRPKNAPPLKAESVEIIEEGTAADTVIRGAGRPFTLRWVKLEGQWYLSPARQRSGEKR
jgi:hypothetical protein